MTDHTDHTDRTGRTGRTGWSDRLLPAATTRGYAA